MSDERGRLAATMAAYSAAQATADALAGFAGWPGVEEAQLEAARLRERAVDLVGGCMARRGMRYGRGYEVVS